jgi:hypothetical protein
LFRGSMVTPNRIAREARLRLNREIVLSSP